MIQQERGRLVNYVVPAVLRRQKQKTAAENMVREQTKTCVLPVSREENR